ncbi:MAG: tetratricopeptide repeat protein [Candidatus Methanofastidiosa archaeon]|nr:tetratricopeptide repeat protein [Candidatus Methanofastidiosa archaeon]
MAFDFSGELPHFSYNTDFEKNKIQFIFEKTRASRGILKTLLIQDDRVENLSVKETEKGIEVTVNIKVLCEITEGNIQKTTLYFDLTEKITLEDSPASLSEEPIGFGVITGQIFDNLSGKKIPGVKVSVTEQNQEVISNDNGTYYFPKIPVGKATIELTHPEYEKESRTISVKENQETYLNIALKRAKGFTSPTPTVKPILTPAPKSIPSTPSIDLFQNQEALEFFQLGEYHYQSNHFEEAINAYQRAIEYDPSFTEAYYKLGISLGKVGKPHDGILTLNKALTLDPRNASIYNALGAMYGMLQQYDKAIEQFKIAIDIDPQLTLAYNNLGILFGKLGDHKRAVEVLKIAVQVDPESAESQGALGVAYAMAGQPHNAIKPLQEAVRIDPTYAKAHFNLGITYLWLGDFLRAKEQYQLLKNLDSEMAQDLLIELQSVEGVSE